MSELREFLRKYRGKRISILCIGNELRGDDSFGILVYRGLRPKENLQLLNCGVTPENFLEEVVRFSPSLVLLVDAIESDRPPGEIMIAPARDAGGIAVSTHKLPLSFIDKYLSSRINAEIVVVGVQIVSAEFGDPPSEEISKRANEISKLMNECL